MSRKLRHRSHHGVHEENGSGQAADPEEEMELLAYGYWQERGCPFGSPEQDWYRAEKEMNRREEAAAKL